jgi:hypothetical protein
MKYPEPAIMGTGKKHPCISQIKKYAKYSCASLVTEILYLATKLLIHHIAI